MNNFAIITLFWFCHFLRRKSNCQLCQWWYLRRHVRQWHSARCWCVHVRHILFVGGHPSPQWKNQVLWCIWGLYIGIVTDSPPNSIITKQQKWDTFCVVGQVPEGRRVHRPLWEQSEDWPRPSHVRVCRLVFSAGLKRRADNQRRYKKGGYFHGHFKDGQRNGEVGKNSGKSVDGCGTCAFCPPRAHRAPSSMPMVISTQAASSRF